MAQVKKLPKAFIGIGEVKGYEFKRIFKNKYVYVYKVASGSLKHYEVFERKINTRFNTETYPSSVVFGTNAYTIMDKNAALKRAIKLSKKIKKRKKHDKH